MKMNKDSINLKVCCKIQLILRYVAGCFREIEFKRNRIQIKFQTMFSKILTGYKGKKWKYSGFNPIKLFYNLNMFFRRNNFKFKM